MNHSIIESPHLYRIIEFNYNCVSNDISAHFIDLVLKKGETLRTLRFYGPQNLSIEKGFPNPTSGMEILDLSNDGLEDINIAVSDFESSWGAIRFVAKSVIDLGQH